MKAPGRLSPLQKVAMVMFVLACLAVFAIFRFLDYPVASWQLNREYERARKNGIPLTQVELKPKGIDEKQNAALELVRIGRAIGKLPEEIDPISLYDVMRVTRRYRPFLPAFYKANALRDYWADTDFDRGNFVEQPELKGYKEIVETLRALAMADAHSGRWNKGLDKIRHIFKLAKHLESNPMLIGQLTGSRFLSEGLNAVEGLAYNNISKDQRLRDLLDLVESIEIIDCTENWIFGETYLWIATLRNTHWYGGAMAFVDNIGIQVDPPDSENQPRVIPPIIRSGKPKPMIARALLMKRLAFVNDAIESEVWRKKDFRKVLARMNWYSDQHAVSETHRVSDRLNAILMPQYPSTTGPYIKTLTDRKAVLLLLKAMLYRTQHHRFPSDLRQISADLSDPYLPDQSLHYRTDGKSVAIWSVGPNMVDDGGHEDESNDIGAYYKAYTRSP